MWDSQLDKAKAMAGKRRALFLMMNQRVKVKQEGRKNKSVSEFCLANVI